MREHELSLHSILGHHFVGFLIVGRSLDLYHSLKKKKEKAYVRSAKFGVGGGNGVVNSIYLPVSNFVYIVCACII